MMIAAMLWQVNQLWQVVSQLWASPAAVGTPMLGKVEKAGVLMLARAAASESATRNCAMATF
jgi:hypothetical protein